MSTESQSSSEYVSRARIYDDPTRARHIRRAWNQQDRMRPPTQKEVGALNNCTRNRYMGGEGDWDDALRTAGVPGLDDIVAEAVREAYEDRHPWQNFVRVSVRGIGDWPGNINKVAGLRLKQIANGERDPEAMDGLRLERASGGVGSTIYEVHPDE